MSPLLSLSQLIADRSSYTVRRLFVSTMNNAVYLLTAKASGEQLLIDAADDVPALESLLAEGAADAKAPSKLCYIVTTHAHWDHTRAVAELRERTGARVAVGSADAPALLEERGVEAEQLVEDGDRLEIDGVSLEVIALVGHTPGSIALATTDGAPPLLFTGDSLFPGGVGNTDGDAGRFSSLLHDVETKLFARFGDDTVVYPGHGDETTLGVERPALDDWRRRGW